MIHLLLTVGSANIRALWSFCMTSKQFLLPHGDVTHFHQAGVLEEIVGWLLNHTPLSITGQRYTRPSLEALRPSMEVACSEILNPIDN
jgi:hypothetical protein